MMGKIMYYFCCIVVVVFDVEDVVDLSEFVFIGGKVILVVYGYFYWLVCELKLVFFVVFYGCRFELY